MCWLAVYVLFAVRRAYADGWPSAVARAVVLQVVYFAGTMAVTYGTLLAAMNAASGRS
ncbi:hypothetical protein BH20VER1_BH20VER1_06270 [soil metagenome]